ncbi:hypothetical protein H9P43_007148 [Blastocladiella emersonii ATCC 22665]|nr:hypothetical protein H9P43_007148 [Blastocladiella emersonii ATCC 22665]
MRHTLHLETCNDHERTMTMTPPPFRRRRRHRLAADVSLVLALALLFLLAAPAPAAASPKPALRYPLASQFVPPIRTSAPYFFALHRDTFDAAGSANVFVSVAPLPPWLSFDTATLQFSASNVPVLGMLQRVPVAMMLLNVTASAAHPEDDDGALVVPMTIPITTIPPPDLINPIMYQLEVMSRNRVLPAGAAVLRMPKTGTRVLYLPLSPDTPTTLPAISATTFISPNASYPVAYDLYDSMTFDLPAWLRWDRAARVLAVQAAEPGYRALALAASNVPGWRGGPVEPFTLKLGNRPPRARNATTIRIVVPRGASINATLASLFDDPDGDPLSVSIAPAPGQIALGTLAVSDDEGVLTGTASRSVTLVATATDVVNATASVRVHLAVDGHDPLAIPAACAALGTPAAACVALAVNDSAPWAWRVPDDLFTLPAGAALAAMTYTCSPAPPAWLKYDPASRTFSGTPAAGAAPLVITIQATDTFGGMADVTVALTVNGATAATAGGTSAAADAKSNSVLAITVACICAAGFAVTLVALVLYYKPFAKDGSGGTAGGRRKSDMYFESIPPGTGATTATTSMGSVDVTHPAHPPTTGGRRPRRDGSLLSFRGSIQSFRSRSRPASVAPDATPVSVRGSLGGSGSASVHPLAAASPHKFHDDDDSGNAHADDAASHVVDVDDDEPIPPKQQHEIDMFASSDPTASTPATSSGSSGPKNAAVRYAPTASRPMLFADGGCDLGMQSFEASIVDCTVLTRKGSNGSGSGSGGDAGRTTTQSTSMDPISSPPSLTPPVGPRPTPSSSLGRLPTVRGELLRKCLARVERERLIAQEAEAARLAAATGATGAGAGSPVPAPALVAAMSASSALAAALNYGDSPDVSSTAASTSSDQSTTPLSEPVDGILVRSDSQQTSLDEMSSSSPRVMTSSSELSEFDSDEEEEESVYHTNDEPPTSASEPEQSSAALLSGLLDAYAKQSEATATASSSSSGYSSSEGTTTGSSATTTTVSESTSANTSPPSSSLLARRSGPGPALQLTVDTASRPPPPPLPVPAPAAAAANTSAYSASANSSFSLGLGLSPPFSPLCDVAVRHLIAYTDIPFRYILTLPGGLDPDRVLTRITSAGGPSLSSSRFGPATPSSSAGGSPLPGSYHASPVGDSGTDLRGLLPAPAGSDASVHSRGGIGAGVPEVYVQPAGTGAREAARMTYPNRFQTLSMAGSAGAAAVVPPSPGVQDPPPSATSALGLLMPLATSTQVQVSAPWLSIDVDVARGSGGVLRGTPGAVHAGSWVVEVLDGRSNAAVWKAVVKVLVQ